MLQKKFLPNIKICMNGPFDESFKRWQWIPIITLIRSMAREFYSEPANRAEFEEWYFQKYGKPYDWHCSDLNVEKEGVTL